MDDFDKIFVFAPKVLGGTELALSLTRQSILIWEVWFNPRVRYQFFETNIVHYALLRPTILTCVVHSVFKQGLILIKQ